MSSDLPELCKKLMLALDDGLGEPMTLGDLPQGLRSTHAVTLCIEEGMVRALVPETFPYEGVELVRHHPYDEDRHPTLARLLGAQTRRLMEGEMLGDDAVLLELTEAGYIAVCEWRVGKHGDIRNSEEPRSDFSDEGEEGIVPGAIAEADSKVHPDLIGAGQQEDIPHYDKELRELTYKRVVLKRFRQQAENQERVLATFEEQGWPRRILDPIPKAGRLAQTVRDLNRGMQGAPIRFCCDGTKQGVIWELQQDSTEAPRSPD